MAKEPMLYWLAFLAVVIGAPLGEELIFRGYMFSFLAKTRAGFTGATLMTSALWALLHKCTGPWFLVGVLFVMGIALSCLLIRFGSLWVTLSAMAFGTPIFVATILGMSAAMSLLIRQAVPGDEQIVFDYVCKLADYESLRHEVAATVGDIRESLFGATPRAYCDLAFWNGRACGLCAVVLQLFHLSRAGRDLSGRSFCR